MSFNYFTGLNIVPTSEWTMDLKGAKQIKMVALGDKRQIMALLSVSKSGHLLSWQLILCRQNHWNPCEPQYNCDLAHA